MVNFFRKYHKWIGLFFGFFIIMFALSGILLNHRQVLSNIDVPRKVLPHDYRYHNWNKGAVTGSLPIAPNRIILYGNNGVWLSDSLMQKIVPFHHGLPKGIDNQTFKVIVRTKEGGIFAVSNSRLYTMQPPYAQWQEITNRISTRHDTFNDLYVHNKILYVVMRSHLYRATYPYLDFEQIDLPQPQGYSNKVSLFGTIWTLHSGEIFGLIGQLVVDFLGIITIILTLTGIVITFWKIPIKRRNRLKKDNKKLKKTWNFSLKWHNKFGYILFFLLLFVAVTGWFLRPPLLIPIVRAKVAPIPYSKFDTPNPWHNKLRNLRYDSNTHQWILYTSDGFYHFKNFKNTPIPLVNTPPVSVMGINVWQSQDSTFLIGSFAGIYKWNIATQRIENALTNTVYKKPKQQGGRPNIMSVPVSGLSTDFTEYGLLVFDYQKGLKSIKQPQDKELPTMPIQWEEKGKMSIWHVSLELHVGRLYDNFLGPVAPFFIFFAGLLFVFTLLSGYVVYRKRYKKKKRKKR